MYKQLLTPLYGLNFLNISKGSLRGINLALNEKMIVIIFLVCSLEFFVNLEAEKYFFDKDLEDFIWAKSRPKGKSELVFKWEKLLKKVGIDVSSKKNEELLGEIGKIIKIRNELIHFKPYEQKTEISYNNAIIYKALEGVNNIKLGSLEKFFTKEEASPYYNSVIELLSLYYKKIGSYPCKELLNLLEDK